MWIPKEIGHGGLTGKVGAWALLAQKTLESLDKRLLTVRMAGQDRADTTTPAVLMSVLYLLGLGVEMMKSYS